MNDPFGDIDRQLADQAEFKQKVSELIKAHKEKKSDRVGELKTKDSRLELVFQFMNYYDAAKAYPQKTTVMKDIEMKYPTIPLAYSQGELLNMVMRGKGRRLKTPSRRKTNGRPRRGHRRQTRHHS